MANTPNYEVNYDDERFQEVETQKQDALTEVDNTYKPMIENADQFYQSQIDASKEWADKQSQLQQENTDFQIGQIEQQKQQAQKDYSKEQSGAYVDFQKQSNKYGASAEQMAMQGMVGSGYSESSQVSMYNQYQNRVAIARESLDRTMQNFNNNIQQAILQNNSALAEISYKALQQQLELSLEGFQYKNTLLMEYSNKKQETDDRYYNRYQNVVNQINTENAMAEQVRQFNEEIRIQQEQFDKEYQLQMDKFKEQIRQFDLDMERLKKKDDEESKAKLKELELERRRVELAEKEYEKQAEVQQQAIQQAIQQQAVATYGAHGGQGSSGANWAQPQANKKTVTSTGVKLPTVSIGSGKNGEGLGNSKTVQQKSNYYFSNGYQPQYIDNTKLKKAKVTVGDVWGNELGVPASQNIWEANGKYYVWNGKEKSYWDVTKILEEW
jgi:hypothetical protein